MLFTLLPDSSSLLVSWPWVFIWQVALFLPWLWLLRQTWTKARFVPLGFGLDAGAGLAVLGLILSTLFAPFPQQACWYSWAALCGIGALYALNDWMSESPVRRQGLLKAQGCLSVALICSSLFLWTTQTLLPELQRLQGLRALRQKVFYDFSVLELRNWAPFGHQNYVAGYLVLSLPLLFGLSLTSRRSGRWFWGSATGLGLIDLYTTSSRGGWLGLGAAGLCGIAFLSGHPRVAPRWRWFLGLGFLGLLGSFIAANNRLRSLFSLTAGEGSASGELAFRQITNAAGWAIGRDHLWVGAGPGSVPQLYQAYRPAWAGREAELVYQLHSTPAQIWTELGLWGIALGLGLTGWLIWTGQRLWRQMPSQTERLLRNDSLLGWSLFSGLFGYGVMSLTDYQLDIVAISGTVGIYLVSLLSFLCSGPAPTVSNVVKPALLRSLQWGTVSVLLIMGLWLAPIHRAWQLSSVGFSAIATKLDAPAVKSFTAHLQNAHELSPWEPYYSAQLGSNLVKAALQDSNVQSADLIQQSIRAFQSTVAAAPHQEYGYSSLGWLQLVTQQPAVPAFTAATRLAPAKRGVFHSLGLGLLRQGKADAAVQAMTLEILRDPLWLTSPVWRSPELAAIIPKVQANLIVQYRLLLQRSTRPAFTTYLHQCLGGLYWWQGSLQDAAAEWSAAGLSPLTQTLVKLAQGQPLAQDALAQPHTPGELILKAWLVPSQRTRWISQALLAVNHLPTPQEIQPIQSGMAQSKSLDDWIKNRAPVLVYRRERAGFGVLSRHIDGPAPQDFFEVVDNVAMTLFLPEVLPSPSYSPDLDLALQPLRVRLWQSLAGQS